MIKLENTQVVGWEAAIRGMRNPMNSWEKSDSNPCGFVGHPEECEGCCNYIEGVGKPSNCFDIGPNDHDLMMRLAKGGPVHAKYRRMIVVYVDITAPLYWWKEFDTYKVGTVANSCSTMHKIAAKEFTLEDFSCEHLMTFDEVYGTDDKIVYCEDCGTCTFPLGILDDTIHALNFYRRKYLETKSKPMKDEKARQVLMKKYWWQMIQLLPSSYNQKRTVMLNYEVLTGIYPSRKDHKLDEWHIFCDWIENLPYSELITGMTASQRMLKIGEELHEGILKGIEAEALRGKRAEVPGIIEDKWLSTPEEMKQSLHELDEIVEKIRNADISSFDDLKKELGIESPFKIGKEI